MVSKAIFQQLLFEFREAWCNQSEDSPFHVEIFPTGEQAFDRDIYDVVARIALPNDVDSPESNPNWYGFLAAVRKDDRSAVDLEILKDLCRRAGASLPVSFRDTCHGLFGRYAFPTDRPQDLWLTLLVFLNGVTWPPQRLLQTFNPFESSLTAIETFGLATDAPQLVPTTSEVVTAGADESVGAVEEGEFVVSYRDLCQIAGPRAKKTTVVDFLRRNGVTPHQKGPRGAYLFLYSDVLAVWSDEQLRESLPPDESIARERLTQCPPRAVSD